MRGGLSTELKSSIRLRLDKILAIIFGGAAGIGQYAYWIEASKIARHATCWEGKPYWTSGGPGSFFPWPKPPGLLTVMTPMTHPVDQVIFNLINSGWYVFIPVGITAFSMLLGWYVSRYIKR